MILNSWLPVGFKLPDGLGLRSAVFGGSNWQIYGAEGNYRTLIVGRGLITRWIQSGLVEEGQFDEFCFGERVLWSISCEPSQDLVPVSEAKSPYDKNEALAFALALRSTRAIDPYSPLQDSLYVEKITRLLPIYEERHPVDDGLVLGSWLSGGVHIPARSFRSLHKSMTWLGDDSLKEVIQTAGFEIDEAPSYEGRERLGAYQAERGKDGGGAPPKIFQLAGRPSLAEFINEHIIDIVLYPDRYKALGINSPSAVILHGPPGCGKTFAVEQLVDFLGWPLFQIDASSVASPYIHETSKKVAQVFEKAMDAAPSILVIDEMEAFLADREIGGAHHRVEEVAEFLRRIPEAAKRGVLIIAMTNRIEMIDPAVRRRGRFDHVIKVDYPSLEEVAALLEKLLLSLPKEAAVDLKPLAEKLTGRPLSDVSFVVREAARLAARSGKGRLDQDCLFAALESVPNRDVECGAVKPQMGFAQLLKTK